MTVLPVLRAHFSALALLLAGAINPANYLVNALHYWIVDMLGVVLITPFVLVWGQKGFEQVKVKQIFEGLLLIGLSFLIGQIVFLDWFHTFFSDAPKGYWMFLCIFWVALHMGTSGVTLLIPIIAIQAILGASQKSGFFAHEIAKANLQNYWAYMLILSIIGMALATYVDEIKRALTALELKNHALMVTANAIVITDAIGRIDWANPAFCRLTGYNLEEVVGSKPSKLLKSGL